MKHHFARTESEKLVVVAVDYVVCDVQYFLQMVGHRREEIHRCRLQCRIHRVTECHELSRRRRTGYVQFL